MHVLIVTSEWPTADHPDWVPFLVQQVAYLRKAGVEMTVFTFRGDKRPSQYLRAWRDLRKQLDLSQFDLIHAQFGQSGLITLPSSQPLVTTFHGSDLQGYRDDKGREGFASRILRQVSRFMARRSDAVIIVAEQLAYFLPKATKYTVIPCGLDMTLFKPESMQDARRTLGLSMEKRYALFAANPERPVKRYALAQEAVTQLRDRWDVELLVATGEPHHRMPLYMNASDLLLLTSRHEGSPTVIKEALACNLPIVSADVGDVRQRLAHIDGCIVVDDETPAAFSAAIADLLIRKQRVESRQSIVDLDEAKIAQDILAIYQQVYDCN